MREDVKIQEQLNALQERRVYWRDMQNFLLADQSKHIAVVFKKRIENLRESFIENIDSADPADSIEIAKNQAKRAVLKMITDEMNSEVCVAEIMALDKLIIQKNEELKRVLSITKSVNPYEVKP